MWSKIKKSDEGEFILSKCELEDLLQRASQKGAKMALAELGLHDENAPTDIRDMRELLRAFRMAKKDSFRLNRQMHDHWLYDADYCWIYLDFRRSHQSQINKTHATIWKNIDRKIINLSP